LEALVDGELTPQEQEQVLDHAARCPLCAGRLALTRRIRDELRALPHPEWEVDPAALPSPAPGHRSRGGWLGWAALAALPLVLVMGWALIGSPSPVPDSTTSAQVAQAEREARFALAQIAQVTRKSGMALRNDVLGPHLIGTTTASLAASFDRVSPGETP
jgi:anti-sigma factor RsiW